MATPSEKEIRERLGLALKSTDATRQDLLRKPIEEGRQEAKAFRRIQNRLEEELDPDDPRLKTLKRRITGNEAMANFIEENLPPSSWVVLGQVTDAKGRPVSGAQITLKSDDEELASRFGESWTNQDGYFEVRHFAKDFEDIFKRAPKARIVIISPDGKLTHTTDEIQPAGGQLHILTVSLQPEKPVTGAKKGTAKRKKEEPG